METNVVRPNNQMNERMKKKKKLSKYLAHDTYFILNYSHELLWSNGCLCVTHTRLFVIQIGD